MSFYLKPIEQTIKAIIRDDSDEMIHLLYEDENLLNSCLNVNIKSLHLDKIEYLACYFKAFKCIEILTLLKVDFNSIQCLNAAAAGGSLEIFERVYSLPKKNFFNKEYVLVPASVAAKFGNINILQYIFSKADALLKNNCHHPIIAAAKYDQVECLQFLLDITSDTNRNKYFFKDVCIAANKTKSDRTLITLYEKYPTPEVRKLIKKFVFKCDSPYLYNKYFGGEKITRGIAQRIIYSNAQRIIKYLSSIGADLNQMLVFINMQDFELLKLSIWSDPIGYFFCPLFFSSFVRSTEPFKIFKIIVNQIEIYFHISLQYFLHFHLFCPSLAYGECRNHLSLQIHQKNQNLLIINHKMYRTPCKGFHMHFRQE